MITAPVSVARSTSRSAPSPTAWCRQSASTRRPSASVLLTSIVFPFPAVTMSPGFTERSLGRFSVAPTTPRSFTGSFNRAIAATASTTAAPPDMSNFISAIFAPGFSEMPPLSNVTALPTIPSSGPFALGMLVAQHDQRGLLRRALRHRCERTHAPRDDLLAALGLDGEPLDLPRQRLRVLGERGRGEVVGGPVLQIPRGVHRRGYGCRLGDGALQVCGPSGPCPPRRARAAAFRVCRGAVPAGVGDDRACRRLGASCLGGADGASKR